MLFRKKKEKKEPRVCTGCGCLIARERAKEISVESNSGPYDTTTSSFFTIFPVPDTLFYCVCCAPSYDRIIKINGEPNHYFTRIPEHYDEVTKEGKPLKKKK